MSAGCSDDDERPPITNGGTDTTGAQLAAFSSDDFSPSTDCVECHQDQVEQWEKSMHAYALRDPVWTALVKLGESAYTNAMDQACAACHGMIGSRAGETPWGGFIVDSLKPVVQEGVTCDLCHTISAIEGLENGAIQLTPGDVKFGTISDPVENTFHKSEYKSLYAEAEYCGACHDIITGNGLELETTFREWRSSGFAVTGKTCNDCHMQPYSGQILGGPPRTLHDHGMPGVDINLIAGPPDYGGQMDTVTALLRNALTVTAVLPDSVDENLDFNFTVHLLNDKTGHGVPSGASFLRQMWLDIMVTDSLGNEVFSSGQLDANDDLMDAFSELVDTTQDPYLYNAQAKIFRADGAQTQLVWESAFLENPAVMPGKTDTVSYTATAPAVANGSLTVAVKLRFRSFPPYTLRSLGLSDLLPIPIVDMYDTTITVTVK